MRLASLSIFLSLYLHAFSSNCPALIQKSASVEQYVDLHPFLNTCFEQANQAIGCQPLIIDVSAQMINDIFSMFTRNSNFTKFCEVTEQWGKEFILLKEGPWENTNYRFGIFGHDKPTHKKNRLIQGINCKISRDYCDWIKEKYTDELAAIPKLEVLFNKLMEIEEICHTALVKKVKEIAQKYPNIEKIFYTHKGKQRIPLSIRITRYDNTGNFCLPLHQDISVLTLILPSDDDPLKECLIISSPKNFALNNLKRPLRAIPESSSQVSGILIAGALMPLLEVPIEASPHAVLPHDREARYVLVVCCHIPNICTSSLNTVLNEMHILPKEFKQKWEL